MEELFLCASELAVFQARHPEYNHYEPAYDKENNLVGYTASYKEEKKEEKKI